MRAAHRIHKLGDGVTVAGRATDVAIEIVRDKDGSVVVLPAVAAVAAVAAEAWARHHSLGEWWRAPNPCPSTTPWSRCR